MINLAEAIRKHQSKNSSDFRIIVSAIAGDILSKKISELEKDIEEELKKLAGKVLGIEEEVRQVVEKAIEGREVQRIIGEIVDSLISKRLKEVKGEKGDIGPRGQEGKEGRQGSRGEKGKDYVLTAKNIREIIDLIPKPRDGADGSPDKPDQVITKINSAEKKIKQSAIEGLEQQFANTMRAIREAIIPKGGGGMGNWIHQSFNVDSSTTTSKIKRCSHCYINRANV